MDHLGSRIVQGPLDFQRAALIPYKPCVNGLVLGSSSVKVSGDGEMKTCIHNLVSERARLRLRLGSRLGSRAARCWCSVQLEVVIDHHTYSKKKDKFDIGFRKGFILALW